MIALCPQSLVVILPSLQVCLHDFRPPLRDVSQERRIS